MSLRYKILAAVIGITVVVLTLVLAVILWELVVSMRNFRTFQGELREKTITWIRNNRSDLYQDNHPITRHAFVRDVVHVMGEEARGSLQYVKGGKSLDQAAVRDLVRRAIVSGKDIVEGNAIAIRDSSRKPGYSPGGVYVTLDIPEFSPHEPLRKVYLVMLVGVVVIIVVIYYVLSRAVIRPIERLDRAAKRVARGDYSRPVPTAGRHDEMDTLVRTFNQMMVEVGNFRQHLTVRVEEARGQAEVAEKSLVIAERLASTGKLASGIAHEVNNPIAGMQNAARMLRRDPPPPPEKQRVYLDLIIDGLQRVQETVKKILQFTPHKVAPQAILVETVLKRALALASHRIERQDMDVFVDLPAEARVFGDPHELQQVFLNILINAMDAVQDAGRKGEISIRGEVEGGDFRIAISDNGCGMSEEHISQAFDLFYTTKEVGEGTGLGLSIAHNVIENHGGRIEIESVLDEGSTFTIVLPLLNGET